MSKYKRNPSWVLSQLITHEKQIITKQNCKIQVPERYMDIGLGQIGTETYILGCFALIMETGDYTVCNINAVVEINPFKTVLIKIDDVMYYEFYFEAGQAVIKTTDVLRRATLIYNILDEFIFKGKVPWFLDYEDLGKLLDTAKSHADSKAGENQETIEFIVSIITRSVIDRSKPLREMINSLSDIKRDEINYVGLNSVFYSVTSTLNKLSGSYFNDGLTSALVNPTDSVSSIEKILRA